MKRYLLLILVSCFLFPSLPIMAANNAARIESSLYDTETNCYTEDTFVYSSDTDSLEATRTITHDGSIIPQKLIIHSGNRNGSIYCGVLTLVQYKYQNNQTITIYKGTLSHRLMPSDYIPYMR